MDELSQFLSRLRAKKDMRQEDFGRLCGVTGRTIHYWETGKKLPSFESIQRLHQIAQSEGIGQEFAAIVLVRRYCFSQGDQVGGLGD